MDILNVLLIRSFNASGVEDIGLKDGDSLLNIKVRKIGKIPY